MNRYPLWKYAIIVVTLLIGVIYTLPNLYGEAPAVQVSPRSTPARSAWWKRPCRKRA